MNKFTAISNDRIWDNVTRSLVQNFWKVFFAIFPVGVVHWEPTGAIISSKYSFKDSQEVYFQTNPLKTENKTSISKNENFDFFTILGGFGEVSVLVGIVCSAPKWWWQNFWQKLPFFTFFDQKGILARTQKSQIRSQNFFPKSGLTCSLVPLEYGNMSFVM